MRKKSEEEKLQETNASLFIIVCIGIYLLYKIFIAVSPFSLKESEVYKIEILINYVAQDKTMIGGAEIIGKDGIKEAVKVLNSIKAYKGNYSVSDLPGDTPSAIVVIYASKSDLEGKEVNMYYDIIVPEAYTFYKIKSSEHDKIADLCEKYGECDIEKHSGKYR